MTTPPLFRPGATRGGRRHGRPDTRVINARVEEDRAMRLAGDTAFEDSGIRVGAVDVAPAAEVIAPQGGRAWRSLASRPPAIRVSAA